MKVPGKFSRHFSLQDAYALTCIDSCQFIAPLLVAMYLKAGLWYPLLIWP